MHFIIRHESPLTEEEDVLNCLNNLFSIPEGSIPLNRSFGLDWSLLDQPPAQAQSDLVMEITEKVDEFEPRVSVTGVRFGYDDGQLTAEVYIEENGT